jgi:hypothetical protein
MDRFRGNRVPYSKAPGRDAAGGVFAGGTSFAEVDRGPSFSFFSQTLRIELAENGWEKVGVR